MEEGGLPRICSLQHRVCYVQNSRPDVHGPTLISAKQQSTKIEFTGPFEASFSVPKFRGHRRLAAQFSPACRLVAGLSSRQLASPLHSPRGQFRWPFHIRDRVSTFQPRCLERSSLLPLPEQNKSQDSQCEYSYRNAYTKANFRSGRNATR